MSSKKTKVQKKMKLNRKRLTLVIAITLFFCFTAIGSGIVLATISSTPAFDPKNLDTYASSMLIDKDGNVFARVHGAENRLPVKLDKIPPHVQNAFIAIEDVRFYEHHGVSLRDIFRAFYINITHQKTEQGASTITQQLARQSFLTPVQTAKRKLQEMYLAIEIERQYTKQEILEMYLNKIYFSESAYGVQAAAQTYFSKDVDQLTISEAATLAAIPKGPTIYDPIRNPKNAKERRNLVLSNMDKYGFIKHDEAEKAKAEDLKLNVSHNVTKQIYNHPYYVDYVIDQLKAKGYTDEAIFKGGLKVYTTMDPKIQDAAEQVLGDPNNFKLVGSAKNDAGILEPQASAIITDQHTGYIKALVGGRDYSTQRQMNRVTYAKRQPGSSIKPILVYGPAIEKGASPASVADDSPLKYPNAIAPGKDWVPKNDDPTIYMGVIPYRTAIQYSINIAAVQILQKTGLTDSINFAKKLGFTSMDDKKANLSYALGTYEVRAIDMAGAYGAFGNKGIYVEPTAITKVEDRTGKVTEYTPETHVAMKETTAYILTSMMQSVVTGGTGTAAQIPNWPVAGKTGTTEGAYNVWFCGYTPAYTGIIWIGHDQQKSMGPSAFGGTVSAPIWQKIMVKAHEGLKPMQFVQPSGIVSATVCSKSGDLPGPNCPPQDLVTDIFAVNTVPTKTCTAHVVLDIDPTNSLLASPDTPGIVKRLFLIKPNIPNRDGDSKDPEPSPPTAYSPNSGGG